MLQQINSYSNYRDDFNSSFVTEFKRTECFRQWQETNRSKIEKSLLNYNHEAAAATITNLPVMPSSSLTSTSSSTNNSLPVPEITTKTNKSATPTTPTTTAVTTTADSTSTTSQLNSGQFQVLFTQLQEVDQRRLAHPFNGQLGVSDIRLRFNFLFSNSESGRKLNRALEEGGKLVNTTSKAVGNVLNSAKSTFSSFLSNWSSSGGGGSGSVSSSPATTNSKSKSSNTKM